MNTILANILISGLILTANAHSCKESKELENSCGRYCYTVVKPILEHTVELQRQVNNQDLDQKRETQTKLEDVERVLTMLKDEISELKQNVRQERLENNKKYFEKSGSHYYYIEIYEKMDWLSAAHKCREFGGNLASIENQEEFEALTSKLQKTWLDMYWLDINDRGHEGVYLSLTTGKNATFLNWHQGEPNHNGNETCVALEPRDNEFRMNDQDCSKKANAICKL